MTSHESYDYELSLLLAMMVDRKIERIMSSVRGSKSWYDGHVERPISEAGKVVEELIELRTMLNQIKCKPEVQAAELITNAKKHIARTTASESREVKVELEGDTDETVHHSTIQILEIWGEDTEHITNFYFTGSKTAVSALTRILEKR